ncbi:hypothetical protein [Cryptosporangium minutisporangium]|uniref:Uncharacterized protein n=1 Tax=Cryptosporangium minutisporangium TaxID=113569 RepID=A0ABP6SZB9_9ACTN
MSARSWPSSPLAAAERAFLLLVQPPTHVGFDGRGTEGLPDKIIPLERLRALMLSPRTSAHVRDMVWRELVVRARRDGPAWVVAAVGVAMPGLRRAAGLLAAGWRGDTHDLDAELLTGFVAHLTTIDLDPPRICGRLIDAGVRAARKARDAESDARLVRVEATGPIAPIYPWDHPELVLARAVAAGVLDVDEAHLIAETRLEGATLAQAGARIGISASLGSTWRRKAEQRLAEAIRDGDLAFIPLRPAPTRVTTSHIRGATSPRPDRTNRLQVPPSRARSVVAGPQPIAVGSPLGSVAEPGVVLAAQPPALVGKASDPNGDRCRAPGIGARPA